MEDLLLAVIASPAGTRQSAVSSAAYQMLRLQASTAEEYIQILCKRLRTSSESGAADVIMLLLNVCVASDIAPDVAENLVEQLVQFVLAHLDWSETVKWASALFHFFSTDEVTVSIFAEYDVPKVAVEGLRRYHEQGVTAAACAALLSHFNFYPIGDGITQLTKCLEALKANAMVCQTVTRTLAEFTSYFDGSADRFRTSCEEFIAADGHKALEGVMKNQHTNEDIQVCGARIVANVTSAMDSPFSDASAPIFAVLQQEALKRFPDNEMLHSHTLRALGNVPDAVLDVSVVANVMKTLGFTSERVAQQAIRCLSSVAMHVKDRKHQIHSTGCIPFVLDAMRRYRENAHIQEEGCNLLSYLSFDSEVITSTITQQGGIQLVLQAMSSFPKAQNLLTAACAALSGLTFNNAVGQKIVLECNGVASIIKAMKGGDKARLQENGCLSIGTMCWNTDLKTEVVRLDGIPVIMKALEEHYTSSGLVKNACRALAQIAFNCERYRDDMSALGVIPLIIRAMAHHPHHDRAQMHGCVALSYLSWTNEANASLIAEHDGYTVIVDAMKNHPHNHEVQEHACRALANISNVSLANSVFALEQIVAAMRRHDRVGEVQEEACRAIVTLSLVSSANKDKLYEINAADRVIAAMQNFPKIHLVQQEACNALAHLAYEHSNLNRTITEQQGVALLLSAMKNHPQSAKVQLNACGGLSALAFDNTTAQRQIFEQGGVEHVIKAMKNFERLRMLELGCSVLGTLAWNADIKEKVAVLAVPEILRAMKAYDDNALLQKSTCRAVSQFAFNSESNRKLLADAGAIPLIVRAMRNHWQTEKLVVHALKALTYLCWENAVVAQAIAGENIEEVLTRVQNEYQSDERVFNEATHLSKILSRKSSTSPSMSSKSPSGTRGGLAPASPPVGSPVPVAFASPNVRKDDFLVPPSPPQQDKEELLRLYRAPVDVAAPRGNYSRSGGGGGQGLPSSAAGGNLQQRGNRQGDDKRKDGGARRQYQQHGNGSRMDDDVGASAVRRDYTPPPVAQPPKPATAPVAVAAAALGTVPPGTKAVFLEDLENAISRQQHAAPQQQHQQQQQQHVPLPKSKRGGQANAFQHQQQQHQQGQHQHQQQQQQNAQHQQPGGGSRGGGHGGRGGGGGGGGYQQQQGGKPQYDRGFKVEERHATRVHLDPEVSRHHQAHQQQPQQQQRGGYQQQNNNNNRYQQQQQQQHYQQQQQRPGAPPANNVIPDGFSDPRFQRKDDQSHQRRGGGGGGGGHGGNARRPEDIWDDPDPGTFHGNRSVGARNWQQEETIRAATEGSAPHQSGGGQNQHHRPTGGNNFNRRR